MKKKINLEFVILKFLRTLLGVLNETGKGK
jgi:hypothetical protein